MIPKDFIFAWREHAPWRVDAHVEQDLVISRALVEIFRVPELAAGLAFRGGTALYKLYLRPAARYSEDIDLVQVHAEPIGDMLDRMRSVLDPWLGTPKRKFKEGGPGPRPLVLKGRQPLPWPHPNARCLEALQPCLGIGISPDSLLN